MINSNIILKEGFNKILIMFFVTLVTALFVSSFLALLLSFASFVMVYAYRNPSRHIYENTQSVLSPIDGKIIAIDKENDKIKIYCKVSVLNNHLIRSPFDSELKVKKIQHGITLDSNTMLGQALNEQISLKFLSKQNKEGLKLKLISGFFNPEITKPKKTSFVQGEAVNLFLDGLAIITVKEKELLVQIGQKITSGQTTLYKLD